MYIVQTRKMRIFIQVFSFIFFILICPLIYVAPGLDKPPVLSADESQRQPDEQFQKAINLINMGSYEEAENILLSFVANDLWQEKAYFLLGRLYKEQGFFDRAEDYLKKVVDQDFLLKDYALKLFADIYVAKEKFGKAIETARQIQNKALLQKAKQNEITALLALKKEKEAVRVLYQYINEYPEEWDFKLILAGLLKNSGKREEAIGVLKDIYINADSLVADALKELEAMDADVFTQEEILKRAENLFERGNFQEAEAAYKEILKDMDDSTMKEEIKFAIGGCQFKQKQYNMAAKSFGFIKSPEAMFWKAKALYRVDDKNGFDMVIKDFEKEYPGEEYLAELLLILADDLRRTDKLSESEEIFRKVLKDFPEKAEDALWGLGWMNYTNGNYKESVKYFSKLTSSIKNKKHYKYLYWEAKSREMLAKNCMGQKANLNTKDGVCPEEDNYVYNRLSGDTGYYGFLAKMRFRGLETPDKIKVVRPEIPKGRVYERIETLKFLGMDKEAADEIKIVLKFTKNPQKFKYLGYTAIDVGEYKSIIYFVEEIESKEFLPLAYPLGYWDVVKKAAEDEAVDAYLIVALIREESRFDPMAVSMAGAVGLMQLMPSTAHKIKKELKIKLRDNSELYDVKKNIFIGTHYLSLLIKEFEEIPLAIAAYNAGENALKRWLFNSNHKDIEEFIEDIPYRETRGYVKKVLRSYWQYRTMEGLPLKKDKG